MAQKIIGEKDKQLYLMDSPIVANDEDDSISNISDSVDQMFDND